MGIDFSKFGEAFPTHIMKPEDNPVVERAKQAVVKAKQKSEMRWYGDSDKIKFKTYDDYVDEILESDYPRMGLTVKEFVEEHDIKGVALKTLAEYLRTCGYEVKPSHGKRIYKNLPVNPMGERAGKAYLNQTKRIKQTK